MAGSRATGDPLAAAAGVARKALVPVGGVAMLARVLAALRATTRIDRIVVCGLDTALPGALGDAASPGTAAIEQVRGAATPGASAALAIESLGLTAPVLVTTADHPLLAASTVETFCAHADAADADAAFALVPADLVRAVFPGVRRTAWRFRDGAFCGCNLYALLTPAGCAAPTAWMRVETHRKRPWRMVRTLGAATLLRFVAGRLALADLAAAVRARTGLRVVPIVLADPAAGFDVDTSEQRRAAEAYLARC
jgi:GTP:adenosylcobinamide-phosphate guanylyltransferase